jgi:alpha-galactosidase
MSISPTRMPALALASCGFTAIAFAVHAQPVFIKNSQLTVSVDDRGDTYEIRTESSQHSILRAQVGAEIDHQWVRSNQYPVSKTTESSFQDDLGNGQQLTTTFSGLAEKPSLIRVLRLYQNVPYGDVEVRVRNATGKTVTVQAIRLADAVGNPLIDLNGPAQSLRVLSDSFSEDRPPVRIHDLGGAITYAGFDHSDERGSDVDVAVGSQLIYNRQSKQGVFFGALSSRCWLTIFHLQTSRTASGKASARSYTIDSTGTTEIEKLESLSKAPPEDQVELSLPVRSGDEIASERVLFAAGPDYHAQLEDYGSAVRRLYKARVNKTGPSGWWSWIGYEGGITSGVASTNAQWLAQHSRELGYNFVLIDEGYQYARGEYATTNETQFPEGMRSFAHQMCKLGLNLGVWTAPFEVSERAWVYQHHKDWLVHNAAGAPIRIDQPHFEALYVLDATHPGAQKYLRQTYRTLAHEWGVKYVKLDFMDDTAIEGYYSQPNATALQAQRIGLEVIRAAVGEDVLIDKDGSPMLNAVGIVDDGRVSTDTAHSFESTKTAASGIAARYYMNRNFFVNDPDAFTVSRKGVSPSASLLPLPEAEAGVVLAALSGGMFDIGGDITTLSNDPERLALAQNRDILEIVNLGRAAIPVDLMTYSEEDEMPSVFLLKEDQRQSMVAVFNWTDKVRSHSLSLEDLHPRSAGTFSAVDSLHPNDQVSIVRGDLQLPNQAPHSVRLIKLVDTSAPVSEPSVVMSAPPIAAVGKAISFSVSSDPAGLSAAAYLWDFGDGVSERGRDVTHAYTQAGSYSVIVSAEGVGGMGGRKTATINVTGEVDSNFNFAKNRRYAESPAGVKSGVK